MNFPKELKYAKTHEWVKVEDGIAVIGLTDFAQDELGDIVFINLPEVGDEFGADDVFADVESVKAVSDINTPVGGTVTEINEELLDAPEKINEAPYEAWLAKVEVSEESDELMSAEEYEAFIESEK
ncbi:MAG: glycine cleavage system protein GcvH [Clostridiales bacterium]|nr:glycine cleavage system protein GcvH [Clostridiales bacterium]